MLTRRNTGRIPTQEMEIITLAEGTVTDVRRVKPEKRANWFVRLLRKARTDIFAIGETEDVAVPVNHALLDGRDRHCLLEARADRPRINLLPGMSGEITVGACRLSAAQLLRDPGLRREEGDSSYALPNGAQARIRCGKITFLIRCLAPDQAGYAAA